MAMLGPCNPSRYETRSSRPISATVFRAELPAPGLYVPRRELTFARGTLVFAHPEREGLRLTTWTVEGGAR